MVMCKMIDIWNSSGVLSFCLVLFMSSAAALQVETTGSSEVSTDSVLAE